MLENRSDDGRLSEASRDELLVVRAQLGDQSAWRELIDRWHPRLHRFVARMVDDVAASEDISQTVWLKVVRSLTSLRDTSNAGPWLYSIARKSVTDHLRRQYRRVPVEPVLEVADEGERQHPVEHLDSIEFGLAQLHPSEREVIVLYYLDQLTLGDVASICGTPVGTVKSRLSRARWKLRTHLTTKENHDD